MQPTPQAPIPSGLGAHTTAREIVSARSLEGKVAIVTGGYAGVGLETTRALALAGATVVVPARSLDKAREALSGLPRVELESLELMSPRSIDAFAGRFLASGRPLAMLIDNAGIMRAPLRRDERGFESQLSTNHIGHFQLTLRLAPALLAAGGARVVSLSSRGHARGGVDFDDPHFERRPYDSVLAYAQSKSANVLFAVGLDARLRERGVRAFAVHPGAIVGTDLGRFMSPDEAKTVIDAASKHPSGFKTVEQGAATSVWCAASPALEGMGGVYCEDCDIARPAAAGQDVAVGVRPWAIDPALADRLWAMSERWTGVTLP